MFFMQLPPVLPITTEEGSTKGVPLADVNNGYLGKIVIFRNGDVKLLIGDVYFDIQIGTQTSCLQEVVYLSPEEKKAFVMGNIKNRTIVTPDVEDILNSE